MGPVGRLGRPSASDPRGVDRCVPSLCCPRCMCVCGVLAHLAPVHRCVSCAVCVCCWWLCPPCPPPHFYFFLFFCSVFFLLFFVFFSFFFFFFKWKRGCVHTAGTGMGSWCTGAVVLSSPVCVIGALSAAAP